MGAGKSTVGAEAARLLGRPFVDLDRELERETGSRVHQLFAERGEAEFRELEEEVAVEALADRSPAVVALGGGAVTSERIRESLAEAALTVWLRVDVDEAWRRAAGPERPLARDEGAFRALYAERAPLYEQAADAEAEDIDDVLLAAAGVHVESGALARLGELVPGEGPVALVTDPRVAGIYGADAQVALRDRLASVHELPHGEAAKTVAACEALWQQLALDRTGTIVALGGGCTTDAAGFAAAGYLRGIPWVPVPTTLVGQVDAAIGGKTALNLLGGKNLVGSFHWPVRTVIDPGLLQTLPADERRAGLAEVVKTGLLAGEELWELPEPEQVRRCAAFKAAVCLRDPLDRGERAILNLGHTFAHALEAAAGYEALSHGHAVALGLLAALRLSGLDTGAVEETLAPKPARVDPERAWEALRRDKKAAGGRIRLVLLEGPGEPRWPAELPEAEVRRALDGIIAN
ncbi:MAG: bifunctional shikimate kinase/3-dehydroquinate synthase [Gaiellaceae bacterium]